MGQLGDSATETTRNHFAPVYGGPTFKAVATGFWTSCGLTTDGAAYCWGHNFFGELGIGTARGPCFWVDPFTGEPSDICSTIPMPVAGGLSFSSLTAGFLHTCGLATTGAAYCWGAGWGSTPSAVAGLSFVALDSGWQHTCALTSGGEAYCWGLNDDGQLGNGSTMQASVPLAVVGGLRFKAIAPGWHHTCGLTRGGVVHCWGDNSYGQFGNGSTDGSLVPVPVALF
jgi:alpha-tubulin suppressor-like RCC1 family protein